MDRIDKIIPVFIALLLLTQKLIITLFFFKEDLSVFSEDVASLMSPDKFLDKINKIIPVFIALLLSTEKLITTLFF